MKKLLITIISCIALLHTAQAQHILQGKIEYERKINMIAQFEEWKDEDWFQQIKASIPKFSSSYFDLSFDTAITYYRPGKEVENPFKMFGGSPASENIVYTNLAQQKVSSQKNIFEQKFLITDSTRKIVWKEKEEIRKIAGFQCHKAVGIVCDSVYVVAFYAEDIPVSGGPEMFGGLPGMILELAIPRLHTTWVAQKVELTATPSNEIKIPEKGKKMTNTEMMKAIAESFKDWGKSANRNLWWCYL